jgi:hypothetical protein
MHSSCQRYCHGKVDGKKKVMGRERRSRKAEFMEKVKTYSIFKCRQLATTLIKARAFA